MITKRPSGNLFFACFLFFLFLLHFSAAFLIAEADSDFFLHDDGNEYLAGVTSFLEKGRIMAGPERYYEACRSSDIPEIWRGVLLPLLTGIPALVLRDPLTAAAFFQALVYVLLTVVLFRIGKKLGGKAAGVAAVLLLLCHPFLTLFSIRYSSENLFILFLALFILSSLEFSGSKKLIFMGITAALAGLVRGTALLFLPAFAVFLLAERFFASLDPAFSRKEWKKIGAEFLLFATSFLLVISPFCIRSYVHYGIWNPAGCLGGFNLYVGNNTHNALAYASLDGKSFLKHQEVGWDKALLLAKRLPPGLSPVKQDKWFREAAWKEIRKMGWKEHFRMTLGKAWHFIRPWPLYGGHHPLFFWGLALWESFLFLAGFAGGVLLWKKRSFLLLLLMFLCVGWLPHTLIHLQMRHRIPFLDLPLILLTACALAWGWQKLLHKWKEGREVS